MDEKTRKLINTITEDIANIDHNSNITFYKEIQSSDYKISDYGNVSYIYEVKKTGFFIEIFKYKDSYSDTKITGFKIVKAKKVEVTEFE